MVIVGTQAARPTSNTQHATVFDMMAAPHGLSVSSQRRSVTRDVIGPAPEVVGEPGQPGIECGGDAAPIAFLPSYDAPAVRRRQVEIVMVAVTVFRERYPGDAPPAIIGTVDRTVHDGTEPNE